MPTIENYLDNLIRQRNALATNLRTKGVPAENSELLDTLVPKVLQIEGGGGTTSYLTHSYLSTDVTTNDIVDGAVSVPNRATDYLNDTWDFVGVEIDEDGNLKIVGNATSYATLLRDLKSYGRFCSVYFLAKQEALSTNAAGRIINVSKARSTQQSSLYRTYSGTIYADTYNTGTSTGVITHIGRYHIFTFALDNLDGKAYFYLNATKVAELSLIDFGQEISMGVDKLGTSITEFFNADLRCRALNVYNEFHDQNKVVENTQEMLETAFSQLKTGVQITTVVNGEVGDDIYATLYTTTPQTVTITSDDGASVIDTVDLTIGAYPVNIGVLAKSSSTITFTSENEISLLTSKASSVFDQYDFVAETAGENIFIYNGRYVKKTYSDKAYVAYYHDPANWFLPILVSQTVDGTNFWMYSGTTDAENTTYGGSFEYGGKTWYYNGYGVGSYAGAMDSSGKNRYYFGRITDFSQVPDMALELVKMCQKDWATT